MQPSHAHAGIVLSMPCALLLGQLSTSTTLGPTEDIYHPVIVPRILVAGVHQPATPAHPTAPRAIDRADLAGHSTAFLK